MINGHRVVAVEEHFVNADYLQATHRLSPIDADKPEVELTRALENSDAFAPQLLDLDARLRLMDEIGQDAAVLSLNPPGVQPYAAAEAVPLARAFNDSLAQIVRAHPGRFYAFGTLAPQDPEAAADELGRVVDTLGMNGVMINSHTGGKYLDEPEFAPVLAAAEERGTAIYLHPRYPSMLDPYLKYGLAGAIWGYQAEAGLHAMRLIMSGTLDRHPGLTILLGHLGEGLPYWLKRIDGRFAFAQKYAGAAVGTSQLELTPSEYVHRNFVLTTSGIDDPRVLELAVDAVGESSIMFAIDAPYEQSAEAMAFLRDAPLSDEQRAKIGYGTAERVLKLS